MDALKKFFSKEPVKRAAKTFLQAAVAYLATNLATDINAGSSITKQLLIGLILSAIAAGLAAVMNLETKEE